MVQIAKHSKSKMFGIWIPTVGTKNFVSSFNKN